MYSYTPETRQEVCTILPVKPVLTAPHHVRFLIWTRKPVCLNIQRFSTTNDAGSMSSICRVVRWGSTVTVTARICAYLFQNWVRKGETNLVAEHKSRDKLLDLQQSDIFAQADASSRSKLYPIVSTMQLATPRLLSSVPYFPVHPHLRGKTHRQQALRHLPMLLLRQSQPAFWPPLIRIMSKRPSVSIRHVRIHPHNGTALEEAATCLHASVWHHALEREAEGRV